MALLAEAMAPTRIGPISEAGPCKSKPYSYNPHNLWEFPKIGDPNIVPKIVGSLLSGTLNKVSRIFGNSLLKRM